MGLVDITERWVEIGESPNIFIMPLSEAIDFTEVFHSQGKLTDSQRATRIDDLFEISFIMDWGD